MFEVQTKYRKCEFKSAENKNGRTMLSSKYPVCSYTKSRFMKDQEAKGLLCSLGLKTPLDKILLLGDIV